MGTIESSADVSSRARPLCGCGLMLWASLALGAVTAGCDGDDATADAGADAVAEATVDVQRAPDTSPVDASDAAVVDAVDVTATDAVDVTASDTVDVTASDAVDVTASDAIDVTASDTVDVTASDGGARDAADVTLVNGCPVWRDPVASPGDAPGDDRYATYARGFFDRYCVRCHASTLRTAEARMGAPDGFNWDVESSIRMQLTRIRAAVGVDNYMPLTAPNPTCDERRRLVRWIDLGAP